MLGMTLLALAAAPAWAGTAGAAFTAVGWQTPARHAILPGVQVWVSHTPKPWAVTGELLLASRGIDRGMYRYTALHVRAAALAELAVGDRATTLHLGVGPALTLRAGKLSWGDDALPLTELDPGLRARVALDGPLLGRLAWSWHMGATVRSRAVDYDTGLGLGVAW